MSSHSQHDYYYYYDDDDSLCGDMARLSKPIAHLQRDLDNVDVSQFDDDDGMYGTEQADDLLEDHQDWW